MAKSEIDPTPPNSPEIRQMRLIAFLAVVFSIGTAAIAIVSVPMLYQYLQQVQSRLEHEIAFCGVRTSNLWNEVSGVSLEKRRQIAGKVKRQVSFYNSSGNPYSMGRTLMPMQLLAHLDQDGNIRAFAPRPVQLNPARAQPGIDPSGAEFQQPFDIVPLDLSSWLFRDPRLSGSSECCTCHQGAIGPPGAPGQNGKDGQNGLPGEMGPPGRDSPPAQAATMQIISCTACMEPQQGSRGQQGPKGPPGPAGDPGPSLGDGIAGLQGPPGNPGPHGQSGIAGLKGPQGEPGQMRNQPGPDGAPGRQGAPGPPGLPGTPGPIGNVALTGAPGLLGDPGIAGTPGVAGPPGPPGMLGQPGAVGTCSHCPPARVAPGF